MSMYDDIDAIWAKMERKPGESDEDFALRLYGAQMDVYSANAGTDIYKPFELLDEETRAGWIERARTHSVDGHLQENQEVSS